MKLAITSEGETLHSSVDPRFGRAKFFVVVDTETRAVVAVSNAVNLNAAQGAGIQAGKTSCRAWGQSPDYRARWPQSICDSAGRECRDLHRCDRKRC